MVETKVPGDYGIQVGETPRFWIVGNYGKMIYRMIWSLLWWIEERASLNGRDSFINRQQWRYGVLYALARAESEVVEPDVCNTIQFERCLWLKTHQRNLFDDTLLTLYSLCWQLVCTISPILKVMSALR